MFGSNLLKITVIFLYEQLHLVNVISECHFATLTYPLITFSFHCFTQEVLCLVVIINSLTVVSQQTVTSWTKNISVLIYEWFVSAYTAAVLLAIMSFCLNRSIMHLSSVSGQGSGDGSVNSFFVWQPKNEGMQ